MAYIRKIDEMIEAPDDSQGHLTCGVEFEFLVPSINSQEPDPDPEVDQYICRSVLSSEESIKEAVLEKVLQNLRQIKEVPFTLMDHDEYHPPHDNVVVYESWRLGHDGSVRKRGGVGGAEGPYHWTSYELSSVVMAPYEYTEQIEDVCRALKTLRIHLNESTSVHVHVGRGDEPFSLLTVKKFATLYWLTEKRILDLHHPSRYNNKFSFRLTQRSILASRTQEVFDWEEQGVNKDRLLPMYDYVPNWGLTKLQHSQLRRIWRCRHIDEVAMLMRGARLPPFLNHMYERGSVGFDRFLPAGKTGGNIQTFEWRQMSGSLDAEHINQWVGFCLAFTDFCRLASGPTFKELAEHVVQKGEDYTGLDLLKALHIDTGIFQHMRTVWSQNPGFCNANKGKELFVPR
jgi:hypothetical protein